MSLPLMPAFVSRSNPTPYAMKKVLTIVALATALLIAGRATAQISINAGYMAQEHNVNFCAQGQELVQGKAAWMQGGFAGVTQNLSMFANLALAPGVFLSFSQVQNMLLVNADSTSTVQTDTSASASTVALKVPFLFNAKFGKVFVFGGPTFNVSLSTVNKLQSMPNLITNPTFDMGASIGAGVYLGVFRIYIGFNAALIDREHFDYRSREAWNEAWEGSTIFAGIGLSFSNH